MKTWRARFAGTSLEEGEAFDGTFDGVVKGLLHPDQDALTAPSVADVPSLR